jgi:hypothetical protein
MAKGQSLQDPFLNALRRERVHLADRVLQQDHELIERLNLPLQLDTIHQINRNRITRSVPERFASGTRSGFYLFGEWYQAARAN